ncbi:MAG: PilZ domain-containing protein [Acidobacteriia bacterium]|nr:PilZ domain-containing protein [Terriglobia bacterium]
MALSRGGLRFKSHKHYSQGSLIEVAFPYSPTGASIFASARIVRAQERPGEGLVEYGVAFVRCIGEWSKAEVPCYLATQLLRFSR